MTITIYSGWFDVIINTLRKIRTHENNNDETEITKTKKYTRKIASRLCSV
jgi:hypothetical protein